MNVKIYPKRIFDLEMINMGISDSNVNLIEDSMFISISTTPYIADDYTEDYYSRHYFKKDHQNVLNIRFDDIEHENINLVTFNESHAKTIVEFLHTNRYSNNCFIHCAAGISRSGALGVYIKELFDEDATDFIKANKKINPNKLVLKILREYGTEKTESNS